MLVDKREPGGYVTPVECVGDGATYHQPRARRSDGGQWPDAVVRLRQSAQGRGAQRGADRGTARTQAPPEGGVTSALRLEPWAGDAIGIAPAHAEAAARTIAILTTHPRPARWGCYLACVGGDGVVGIGAFKAAPDPEGTVEIAYQTFPAFEGRGYARSTIAALVNIAQEGRAVAVIAHTLPQLNPSARALRRNGFIRADAFDDREDGPVWYWERVLDRG